MGIASAFSVAIKTLAQGPRDYAIPAKVLRELPLSSSSNNPAQGETLSDAHLPPAVQRHILKELIGTTDVSGDDFWDVGSETFLSRFRIGPDVAPVLRVDGGGHLACGATGNCPILFLDTETGAVKLDGNGWKVIVLRPIHNGAHDLAILHNMSACGGEKDEYRYDGKRYRRFAVAEYGHLTC